MCTRQEVEEVVDRSEHRMNERLEQSHIAVAKTISNLGADVNERLDAIIEQTTKTNGRVTSLETWKEVHKTESLGTAQAVADIKTTLSRLNWLLITAVFVAALNLIIKQ